MFNFAQYYIIITMEYIRIHTDVLYQYCNYK